MPSRILPFMLVVLTSISGVRAADTDAEFQAAKQAFFKEMKKRSASDRADAIAAFAEVARPETADFLLKRGFSDPEPQVRKAAQQGLAKLADNAEVSKLKSPSSVASSASSVSVTDFCRASPVSTSIAV